MADGHELPSSSKDGKFALDIIDVTAIKLLKEQARLVYDGNRFQWNQQFDQLRNFVTNTVRLKGKWRSPGGRAKRFDGRNCHFSMTWYSGKCNSLLFFGTDRKSFKELLVSILNLDSPKQSKADNDEHLLQLQETWLKPCRESGFTTSRLKLLTEIVLIRSRRFLVVFVLVINILQI